MPVVRRVAAALPVAIVLAAGMAAGVDARLVGTAPTPAKGAAPWAAPADPMSRTVSAGLKPERSESFIHHVHAHLDVFVNGKHVRVPAGIGINIHDPGVRTFKLPGGAKAYGGIGRCAKACISPLHTHDTSGTIHVESNTVRDFTLHEFLAVWGQPGDGSAIDGHPVTSLTVDGVQQTSPTGDVVLKDGQKIVMTLSP